MLTASIGTVVDEGGGNWSWSYDSTDDLGPVSVTITATDDDGGEASAMFDLTVNNLDPTITVDNAAVTVNEGETATNLGTFADVPADIVMLTASIGTVVDEGGGNWSWSYDSTDDLGPVSVTITATDDDGGEASAMFDLTVNNVDPTADAGGPYFTFDDTPITLSGSGSDPAGALDPLTFVWDLDDDGMFGETGVGATRGDEIGANPVFDPTGLTTGSYTVTLRVSDGDGGVTDDIAEVSVLSTGTLLIGGTLYIVGSDTENDTVFVVKHFGNIKVYATFNDDNPVVFDAGDVSHIEIRTRGGHDKVIVSHSVNIDTTIDGGSGNDVLLGGSGDDLIIGGAGDDLMAGQAGNDMLLAGDGRDDLFGGSGDDVLVAGDADDLLYGGSGRDLLIGGQDNDWLDGGSDDDILIGGVTIHDDNTAALDAVMAVWTSSMSFADRVETLTEAGGLLEAGVAVFDDDDSDVLIGGSGRDLLFADITWAGGDKDFVLFSHQYDHLEVVN
jgi:Ca2+-binding RTX toxin-like protein